MRAEIARIENSGADALARLEHEQHPAILQGLFRGQPIEQVATIDAFAEYFGDTPLTISQEYSYNEFEAVRSKLESRPVTLAEYLELLSANPSTPFMCVEGRLPDPVRALLEAPPAFEKVGDPDDFVRFRFFLGNQGNCANFHFDADMRSVILHQIFGYKTVLLVPPRQSRKMQPVMNFSGWLPQRMCATEFAEFVEFIGAHVGVLGPGETLFVPTGWWHHIMYDTLASSFNIGFRRCGLARLLGGGRFHWTYRSAAVVARDAAGAPTPPEYIDRLLNLVDSGKDPDCIFDAVEEIYAEMYSLLCADHPPPPSATPYPIPERFYWKNRLDLGLLYASPVEVIAN